MTALFKLGPGPGAGEGGWAFSTQAPGPRRRDPPPPTPCCLGYRLGGTSGHRATAQRRWRVGWRRGRGREAPGADGHGARGRSPSRQGRGRPRPFLLCAPKEVARPLCAEVASLQIGPQRLLAGVWVAACAPVPLRAAGPLVRTPPRHPSRPAFRAGAGPSGPPAWAPDGHAPRLLSTPQEREDAPNHFSGRTLSRGC